MQTLAETTGGGCLPAQRQSLHRRDAVAEASGPGGPGPAAGAAAEAELLLDPEAPEDVGGVADAWEAWWAAAESGTVSDTGSRSAEPLVRPIRINPDRGVLPKSRLRPCPLGLLDGRLVMAAMA